MRKRIFAAAIVLLSLAGSLWSQQITRVAVVDLDKVAQAYPRDSGALLAFESKKAQIQQEIDARKAEILALQAQKVDSDKAKDSATSARLDAELAKRVDAYKSFVRTKKDELDREAAKLNDSDSFVALFYQKVQFVAETAGYSLVINLSATDSVMRSIVWYSPMIDITADVVTAMTGKAK